MLETQFSFPVVLKQELINEKDGSLFFETFFNCPDLPYVRESREYIMRRDWHETWFFYASKGWKRPSCKTGGSDSLVVKVNNFYQGFWEAVSLKAREKSYHPKGARVVWGWGQYSPATQGNLPQTK